MAFFETMTVPLPVSVLVPAAVLISLAAAGESVAPEFTVRVPVTAKLPVVEIVPAEDARVRFVKDKLVPEFAMDEPLFIVMVPELGARVQVAPLVSTPATEKLVFAVTDVAEQAVVRL